MPVGGLVALGRLPAWLVGLAAVGGMNKRRTSSVIYKVR